MADQQREGETGDAREAAIYSLVSNLVGLAFQLAVIGIVVKRDWLMRQALRYRWYVRQEWRGAARRRTMAEFRTELSRMEHEGIPDA